MTGCVLEGLRVLRGACPVVDDVSARLLPGEFVGLIGPNGAGKTTVLRAGLGFLPRQGTASLADMTPAERARAVAWLPQAREIAWPVTVQTLVALGRIPHVPRGAALGEHDRAAVSDALARMDLAGFEDRSATALSGGEQARVLIARALAQETPVILADEPISGLDPAHQIAAMKVFRGLADEGKLVVAALHDLPLAARYCTRLLLMNHGQLVADGPPDEVLTEERLAEVFGVSGGFSGAGARRQFQVWEAAV